MVKTGLVTIEGSKPLSTLPMDAEGPKKLSRVHSSSPGSLLVIDDWTDNVSVETRVTIKLSARSPLLQQSYRVLPISVRACTFHRAPITKGRAKASVRKKYF